MKLLVGTSLLIFFLAIILILFIIWVIIISSRLSKFRSSLDPGDKVCYMGDSYIEGKVLKVTKEKIGLIYGQRKILWASKDKIFPKSLINFSLKSFL